MDMTPMQAGFVVLTGLVLYLGLIALPKAERRILRLEQQVEQIARRTGIHSDQS